MGRPLSRQQLFNANSLTNIKVHFHNGSTPVKGYILRQRSTKWFLCSDVNGNTAKCKLVDKVRADLLEGEMSIAFVYDDGTKGHAIKIARHLITVMYDGMYRNMPWTFDANNSDGRWQIDEAGTNTNMASDTDVGGEDINGDYPVPGSSGLAAYRSAAQALTGITYANKGSPYNPGGGVLAGAISNKVDGGLWRSKYSGNFSTSYNDAPNTWDYHFFVGKTPIKSISDGYLSWGKQLDGNGLGENHFSMEWKGYFQAPDGVNTNYNIFAECDDQIAVWIGSNALGNPWDATPALAIYGKSLPANAATAVNGTSVTLEAGKWYPIRIWFGEFGGACMAQIYLQSANDQWNGQDLNLCYNSATGGF